ncbi:NAD(P)/FAD-dependent oxidoreductase [Acidithiobacillus sp. AMEEHan]|uniref:flavin monoamine oxidase family protein n=1 Tax=Acidithiobacillus sp. AMEEHan TaxID=2994951 RepID=UPI0027E48CDB|nr:NAD(P)/FAD-dependent oxidoreductase [Acidithiobacillus sp. AMEEHan]
MRREINERKYNTICPDFPFDYLRWITSPEGVVSLPAATSRERVAVIGAGLAGTVAAYELAKAGLRPVVYEAGWIGGRLRSHRFDGVDEDVIAELGGMRFPASALLFWHYASILDLSRKPFPNPMCPASGATMIELMGNLHYGSKLDDFPDHFRQIMDAWRLSLNQQGSLAEIKQAWKDGDVAKVKDIWNRVVQEWDDRSFYDFLCASPAFQALPYDYKEIFGQIGFGTGGWDSDFQNTMLEILRVIYADFDSDQYLVLGGAQQIALGLWKKPCSPEGLSVSDLNQGAPQGKVRKIFRARDSSNIVVENEWGNCQSFAAVLVTCQSWLLTTSIDVEESLFSDRLWMALDRTRYMQSSKTFVLVDRPFWLNDDHKNGIPLRTTLSDRLTRGTYLFDYGQDKPAVICLTYSWMGDALKMLPLTVDQRTRLSLGALRKIYPDLDLERHIRSRPVSISWELEENFLGAFKGALPGHYRYNRTMYTQFYQEDLPIQEKGIFLAGDDISWTPGWAEGAIQTALNAVWGVFRHLGGRSPAGNPGPGDQLLEMGPLEL